jgi:hypothetical protein
VCGVLIKDGGKKYYKCHKYYKYNKRISKFKYQDFRLFGIFLVVLGFGIYLVDCDNFLGKLSRIGKPSAFPKLGFTWYVLVSIGCMDT